MSAQSAEKSPPPPAESKGDSLEEQTAMSGYAAAAAAAQTPQTQQAAPAEESAESMDVTAVQDADALVLDMTAPEAGGDDPGTSPIPDTPDFLGQPSDAASDAPVAPVASAQTPAGSDDLSASVAAMQTPATATPVAAPSDPVAQTPATATPDAAPSNPVAPSAPLPEGDSVPRETLPNEPIAQAVAESGDPAVASDPPPPQSGDKLRHEHHSRSMQWRIHHRHGEEAPAVPQPVAEENAIPVTENAKPADTTANAAQTEATDDSVQPVQPEKAQTEGETPDWVREPPAAKAEAPAVKQADIPGSAATEKFIAQSREVISQIVEQARMSKFDGTSRLEIQLQPEHLGKLSIALSQQENGLVSAQIRTSGEQVSAMLRATLGELEASLKNLGITMDNIEISEHKLDFAANQQQSRQHQADYDRRQAAAAEKAARMLGVSITPLFAAMRMPIQAAAVRNAYLADENLSVEFRA
jgi:flagellar hook-length control protein FliK